ncbi:Retrovirus-related Pol polyprotein from transposon RE1 [Vitis vinifera]|uniref:Retrovirus-related Pol polyprotein from transposon RE1 n=1 Tax=Vitis vinifera TaxID=29760 RepID=A0A438CIE8_VITVI|nr:Retrovirus-related Pol polyprotein from transposon RE1 [Vitis vinifera]
MITKSKNDIFKPKVYSVTKKPQSIDEALQNENWKIAMIDEYSVLLRNNTWSLVDLPVGRKVIGCKWIFRVKEIQMPVVKPTTIWVALTIALSRNWKIQQLDINNAFLNEDIQEEVYMEQPKGFIEKSTSHLVKHTTEGLHLSQTKYVHDFLCKAKMNNANGINTPMISGQQLTTSGSGTVKDVQLYRSVVGALQYVTITRP